MRLSRRHLVCTAAILVAGLLAGAAVGVAQTPRTGAALKAALPAPDKEDLTRVQEFVGLNSAGGVALAVAVHRNGSVVAFVCDGQSTWGWFTGKVGPRGRLDLKGKRGRRLVGRIRGRRVRARVVGASSTSARAAQADLSFTLKRAVDGAGLRRLVANQVEVGWITTNEGKLLGVGAKGPTIVATTNTTSSSTGEAGEANPGPGASDPQATGLFNKIRCGAIVLKFSKVSATNLGGGGTAETQQQQTDLQNRFGQHNCFNEGFAL
jgi:hypothetical protein